MKVNGKELSVGELSSPSVSALLQSLKLKPETVAIQRNGEILKRGIWEEISLKEEDRIEILKFVGGG
ncbi:sulfur carrier protein ThiS [Leptospira wolffii]|uniref:Sulfur carrier protein ThiS n=1 Tax=Leptospira wolffii TaxID=409998 RepID=A0ABV5BKV8_9LEPT|nr:sulfur carrier protein ThiS [Leptospira wolffii]EPG67633.1 thiamine biosynthesis protein ThiS [Leptospira wolffii serovar Khorat str. Khorat-H2]TGL46433.1 sulfur carrier protein ThiS [Leptospira wolffii]